MGASPDGTLQDLLDIERTRAFHTPCIAFAQFARLAGLSAEQDGLQHGVCALIPWPPPSVQSLLHQLRDVFQRDELRRSTALSQEEGLPVIDRAKFTASAALTRTQQNFLCTLQRGAHRARDEVTCALCGLNAELLAAWTMSSGIVRRDPCPRFLQRQLAQSTGCIVCAALDWSWKVSN
eukprot:3093870-Amphidinium_carterae.1